MLIDYALNYFPSTLLTLATIWAAYRIGSGRRFRNARYCLIIFVAFLTGVFHEGFSMPLLAALSVIAATRRFSMPGQWWGVYIALLCGTIISAGSPAIWTRFFTVMDSRTQQHLLPYLRTLVKNHTGAPRHVYGRNRRSAVQKIPPGTSLNHFRQVEPISDSYGIDIGNNGNHIKSSRARHYRIKSAVDYITPTHC